MTDAAGLVPFDLITSLTNAYQDERRRIDLAASFLAEETGPQGVVRHFLAGNVKEDRGVVPNVATLFKLEGAVAALNSHYWQKAIELTDVLTVMPQARRDEWHEQIRKHQCPEFSADTVKTTLGALLAQRAQFLGERVDGIFRGLSGEHVTNQPQGFSKRMIIAGVIGGYGTAEYRKTGLMTTNVRTAAAIYMGDVGYQTGGADGGWIEWMRGPERAEQRVRISLRIRARAHHAADYRKIHAAGEDIYTAVKVFEQSVWFHWLKGYWNKTQARGHKASIDGLTLLVWGCAGRVMMTLRDPATKASVTVITDAFSNEPCMTAQGIEATREDALRLLAEARAHRGALRIAMKPDAAVVKMAGL